MRITIEGGVKTLVLKTGQPGNEIGGFVTSIEGWYGPPAPRESPIESNGHDGDAWPSALTEGPRYLTFECYERCVSSIEAGRILDLVAGLSCERLRVTVEDALGARSIEGFVSDDPTPRLYEDGCVVAYTLVLTCPYPNKKGDDVSYPVTGGQAIVRNGGNVASWPRVEVEGRVTALELSHDGHRVTWTGNADGLSIDMFDMSCSSGSIGEDDAFSIAPGTSPVGVSITGSGTPYLVLADAWR